MSNKNGEHTTIGNEQENIIKTLELIEQWLRELEKDSESS
jgi:hypothetical protein